MRLSIRFILLLIPSIAFVVYLFTIGMDRFEKKWVFNDLNHRSRLLADSLQDSILESISNNKPVSLNRLLNRVSRDSRLVGIVVCSTEEAIIGKSDAIPGSIQCEGSALFSLANPVFIHIGTEEYHRAVFPLTDEEKKVKGFIIMIHDPSYMIQRGQITRTYAIAMFLGLGFLISMVTLLVYRWSISVPLNQLSKTLKLALTGDWKKIPHSFEKTALGPLVKSLDELLSELQRNKNDAIQDISGIWTAAKLRKEVNHLFKGSKLCVIANREPYIHNRKGQSLEVLFPASGLVSGVEPIVRACSGLWIGHGSGSGDRETADKKGLILVPPGKPEYALKRVWLTREEERGYYYGFSNEGIWPLCHIAHNRPLFRAEDWRYYLEVNRKFAAAFEDEMKMSHPIALIQDYHFALLPAMIRKLKPDAVTSLFWHIPWPNSEAFGICPWKEELLLGMLGGDLIGFHTQYHCNNFLDTVDRFLEARVDRDSFSVTIKGHTCYVKPFSISTEWPPKYDVPGDEIPKIRRDLLEELLIPQESLVAIGVDRIDYTKGIIERLLSVESLLERYPETQGRFVFIQIGAPSRTQIKRYQNLNVEIQEVSDRINWRFQKPGYQPIMLRLAHHDPKEVFRYYRAADLCIVSSLHDGMNLVAKEFISSRSDVSGALVLSSFTGAARELKDAYIINPYDTQNTADTIYRAISCKQEENKERMTRLRYTISNYNVYTWAAQFLTEVHQISEQRKNPTLEAV
ncbi:MAG: trehalose-6-phosphate synthase [Nitrospiria bacterium]